MRLTALSRIAQWSEEEVLARLESLPEYNDLPDGGAAVREYWQEFLNKPQAEVVIADDLSEDEKKQFIIKDNVNYGDWDYDELENWDAAKLDSWGVDTNLPDFGGQAPEGFGEPQEENEKDKLDKRYSHKLGKVIYEPKESNHKICDLFKDNSKKFEAIINKIENEELREMLKLRAAWFVDFNFEKIADYYAYQATKEEQKCIEALGLVLLDYDGLIENGFSDLLKDFENEDNH